MPVRLPVKLRNISSDLTFDYKIISKCIWPTTPNKLSGKNTIQESKSWKLAELSNRFQKNAVRNKAKNNLLEKTLVGKKCARNLGGKQLEAHPNAQLKSSNQKRTLRPYHFQNFAHELPRQAPTALWLLWMPTTTVIVQKEPQSSAFAHSNIFKTTDTCLNVTQFPFVNFHCRVIFTCVRT